MDGGRDSEVSASQDGSWPLIDPFLGVGRGPHQVVGVLDFGHIIL